MKTILIAGASVMASVNGPLLWRSMRGHALRAKVAGLFIVLLTGISAQADLVGISYSDIGALTGPPELNGTILTLDALANGSIISGNPALNAVWNPVTIHTHDFLDITTGLDHGIFSIAFADGDTLSGNLFEVDSAALLSTNVGPFTQKLTFTGGTGQFTGASGFVSGEGFVGPTGTFTASGSGTLTATDVSAPEPALAGLIFGGLLVMVGSRKRLTFRKIVFKHN